MKLLICVLCIFTLNFSVTSASAGDQSFHYQNCIKNMNRVNCTKNNTELTPEARSHQDVLSRLFGWGCLAETRYHCMWVTVNIFKKKGYPVPKFHGKWPFKRYLGMQEPASAICSLLNLAANVYMWYRIIKDQRFSYGTPLLFFWHMFILVCVNSWMWSTIFHTRDTPFTEFMDYSCAFSMVMGLFIAAVVRILHKHPKTRSGVSAFFLVFFADHVMYLWHGLVDYEYNMNVNVFFGVVGSLLWIGFSVYHWRRRRYVWRLVLFTALSGAALLLELGDFPPVAFVLDAHALWHMATAPLPLLFYRFVMDDMESMQWQELQSRPVEKTDLKLA